MIQSIRKLILLLPLLFAGALVAIHAQPYDNDTLRTLFADPACTAACFIGIQPGVTTLGEAVTVLEHHPWIGTFDYDRGMASGAYFFSWTWSGAQPAAIDYRVNGQLWVDEDRVQWIEVATRFSVGDLWLVQRPERTHTALMSVEPRRIFHEAEFGYMSVYTRIVCPLQPTSFWVSPVVVLAAPVSPDSLKEAFTRPNHWTNPRHECRADTDQRADQRAEPCPLAGGNVLFLCACEDTTCIFDEQADVVRRESGVDIIRLSAAPRP